MQCGILCSLVACPRAIALFVNPLHGETYMQILKPAVLVLAAVVCFGAPARALDQKAADVVINKYLEKQKTADGEGQSSGNVIADLNGDGKPEIVLLWAFKGATYAYN